MASGPDDGEAIDFRKSGGGVGEERVFVRADPVEAKSVKIIDGGAEADDAGDVGRAGFEFVGKFRVFGFSKSDGGNHVTAALIGGHGVKEFAFSIEYADAGGTDEFVAAEDVEIGIKFLDIGGSVSDPLGAVDEDFGAGGMGDADDVGNWVDRAQGIADVIHCDHFDAPGGPDRGGQELLQRIKVQFTGIIDRDDMEDGTRDFADHLPGNDVGVMFEMADDNFVSRLEKLSAPTAGVEVDAFCGTSGEKILGGLFGIQKRPHLFTGGFVQAGGGLAELVDAPMDIGVLGFVVTDDGINDGARFLRGGGVIEVDEGFAVGFSGENGEIASDSLHIP